MGQNRPKTGSSKAQLPTLFIIGDSTVNNSGEGFQGWGNVIGELFDKAKINIENRARGGRSSRTFYTEGLWDQALSEIKKGDFVLIQFGHNDGGPIDKEKARGSLKGVGDETKEIIVEATGKKETVHTYGWYIRKFISDARSKGGIPIVLSPIPRNIWKEGKVVRASTDYGKWAEESAKTGNAFFVDLNEIIAERYEKEGQEKVAGTYFTSKDHTHTTPAGARLNAASVVEGLKKLKKVPLRKYLLKH
ncbi:MAG TPA: rhamnogalacturonan acetylesterase [Pyrinomonadaceae bacterium]|nr:rhamnogalacturonan acetylesterase [Pyrinomonadaceae bacterium]